MAQYCPTCQWYSADGLAQCSTCGAPFEDDLDEDEAFEEVEQPSLIERIGWPVALAATALVGGSYLYNRYAGSSELNAAGSAVGSVIDAIVGAVRGLYQFVIGPNGEYKDFVVIAVAASAFLWLVLWLMARFGRG